LGLESGVEDGRKRGIWKRNEGDCEERKLWRE
jgi:hypothetical protein